MTCKQMETRLMDYLEGNLPACERQEVELHARGCSLCAERMEGFSGVYSLLDSWPGIEPSPLFNARLRQRMEEPAAASWWWDGLWARLIPLPAGNPVFALALLLVVAMAGVIVRYSPAPTPTLASQRPALMAGNAVVVDDIGLYRNLPVLEDLDVLRNFEVLQDFNDAGH